MKNKKFLSKTLLAGAVALLMAGCTADGDSGVGGGGGGGLNAGGGSGTLFPNDGSVGGVITENGNVLPGRFICTASAQSRFGSTTEVGANGLVGGTLTPLLNTLGAGPATTLLNSVVDKDLTIDGDILTGSTFTLPVGLLLGLVDTVDQSVLLPTAQPAGTFAVFGVILPPGTVQLSLTDTISVTTFLNGVEQETQDFDQTALDLLGFTALGDSIGFFGLRSTQPFDRATISLNQLLVSANVGPAMYVHEMCTSGILQ